MLFLPDDYNTRDVSGKLIDLAHNCTRLRSVVPYHTLAPQRIGGAFADLWFKKGSFHCVDISNPTDLEVILEMVNGGADVYIMLRKKEGSIEGFHGLLHPKVYLFDYPDGAQRVMIGSHNFTYNGINGTNVEASLVLDLVAGDAMSRQIEGFLEAIKADCEKFDPKRIEEYRRLQKDRSEYTKAVVTLQTGKSKDFEGETITIFGKRVDEYEELKGVGSNVIVRILRDGRQDKQDSYEATILDSGYLQAANQSAGGLSYSARYHAFWLGARAPDIEDKSKPDMEKVAKCSFFVTLQLTENRGEGIVFREPINASEKWESDDDFVKNANKDLQPPKKVKVSRPNKDVFSDKVETVAEALRRNIKLIERMVVKELE